MKKSTFMIVLCMFFTTSCKDMLKVEPTHAVDIEIAINSYTGLRGLLMNVYDDLQSGQGFGSEGFSAGGFSGSENDVLLSSRGR